MMVGEPGAAVSGALLLMCEVLVLEGLTRAAQPSGSNSRIHPVRVVASTATSQCVHEALVKSIVMKPVVDSAVIRCGTVHCPRLLEIGRLGLEHECVRLGQGVACDGSGMGRQIRHQHLELAVGLGLIGLSQPLIQLRKVDAAVAGGDPQPASDSLPIRISRPGRGCRDQWSR